MLICFCVTFNLLVLVGQTMSYNINCSMKLKCGIISSSFALYGNKHQRNEDFKINSQIARLNAVAAKLRAEAAELEVCLPSFK